jgi:ParB-like chromosome segregation protein Spo0J
LSRFGLVDPLIVNKHKERKNILVGGHQRLKIAREMGMDKIPCVEVDLNIDQEKELNIRLNKNVGEWDYDSLANYFDVGALMDWGFTDDELQFYEEEPKYDQLIDDDKNKPPKMQITFQTFEDQENAIKEISKILEKYKGSYYSLSGGQI